LTLEEAQYFLNLYQDSLMPDNIRSILFMNASIRLAEKLQQDAGSEHERFTVLTAVGFDLNNYGLIYQVQEADGEGLRHWFSGLGYSPDQYTEGGNGFCYEPSSLVHPKSGQELFPIFTEQDYRRRYE